MPLPRDQCPPSESDEPSKVPQGTLAFWAVKILATTLGETGGDAVSMTRNLGYAVGSLIFLGFFLVTLTAQVRSSHYHPVFTGRLSSPPQRLGPRLPTTSTGPWNLGT